MCVGVFFGDLSDARGWSTGGIGQLVHLKVGLTAQTLNVPWYPEATKDSCSLLSSICVPSTSESVKHDGYGGSGHNPSTQKAEAGGLPGA